VSNSRVRLPATLVGGAGNDTIFDGLGIDWLFADSGYTNQPTDGVDELHSTDDTPGDTLVGRIGVDTFEIDAGDIIIPTS
jgi:Ca2+-binding RTX toxin-like protein